MSATHSHLKPVRIGLAIALALATTTFLDGSELQAQARGASRARARTSVHASNTNVNVGRNVNVDRNVNVNVHNDYHYDRWGHPIARAAAVTATAVALGTVVASLPPKCDVLVVGGVTYQSCGGVYYQPVYQGTTVQYVVVNHP
jgi:hypothetical protein